MAGKHDHPEALDKQSHGMLALDRISSILLPKLPGQLDSWAGLGIQRWASRVTLYSLAEESGTICPLATISHPANRGGTASYPVDMGRCGSIFRPGGTTTF